MVTAEKRKTKKTKHSKTKQTITSSKQSLQSMQSETEIHEQHVDQMHTLTEQHLQSSRIEYDNLPENTTTELITDSAIVHTAQPLHHSIYPHHEVNATQTGNEMGAIDMPECKSHAVIDTLQSVSVSEANLNETVVPTKFDKMPQATHILPSIPTKQSLTNDETLTHDTYDDLRIGESARSATAKLEYVAVEAKMIDEPYVQENESELAHKMPAMQGEKADVSVGSMYPIEVQLRNAEETISDLPDDVPIRPATIAFDVSEQKSLNVTETVCEQKTSQWQPQPLAPSAKAVTDFELHRPYTVEETRTSENEKTIPLMAAVNEQQASVNVTCMDSVAIEHTVPNEFETELVVCKPETANADNLFKPYHTTQTNLLEFYEGNDSLENFKYELSHADIEMNQHNVNFTEMTNVYQSEEELKPQRRSDKQRATPTFVPLKSSITEQMVPNESENELKLDATNAEHATRATESTKVLEISSVQPLESVAQDIPSKITYEKQRAKIDFELQKSAMVNSLVYSNEKETDFTEPELQVQPIVRHDDVENNPIESSIMESLDSECAIETEQTQFRQSKLVAGHALTLGSVNVVEPCDAVDSIRDQVETNQNAKLITDNVFSVTASSVHPTEQVTDGIDSAKPNYKFASPNLICQNAVEISSQSTEESFSPMEINLSESKVQQIPLKPSDSLLQSANVFEPYSLESVGDVSELVNDLKIAGTHFAEHHQVNVSETITSEQIISDDVTPIQPSTAKATSQFTHQTAATVSLVLPSDSTCDVTYDLPELAESKFSFDTKSSLCIHEEICQEATTQMHTKEESKQYRPSSSFVHQFANEQMEIDLLENPDILSLSKAEICVGNTSITNAFVAPEVSNILIHGSENIFDAAVTKPMALAKSTADDLNAVETTECVILESSDNLRKSAPRIESQAPSTAMQEAFSHAEYAHNVFEKESELEAADKFEHKKVEWALESPLKPANVTENVQLFSVEQLPTDRIEQVEPIHSHSTNKLVSSAAEETTVIFESEDHKEVDSCEHMNIATVSIQPQLHVTVEANELNESAVRLVTDYESNESKCIVTNEPCLPVTINETMIASEVPKDRKQIRDEFKTANMRVSESHKFDEYETIANIDCRYPSELAMVRSDREVHSLQIIEKAHLEKECNFLSDVNERISQKATIVEHTIPNLMNPIQTYEEKTNINIENEYHKEQVDRTQGLKAIDEGKWCAFEIIHREKSATKSTQKYFYLNIWISGYL